MYLFALFLFLGLFTNDQPDCFIRNIQTDISIVNGKKIIAKHVILQINNRDGEWISEIQIGYNKGNRIKALNASIQDLNQNVIRKAKKSDFLDRNIRSNSYTFSDDFVREVTLKHNQYPYLVDYSYTQEYDEFLHLAGWWDLASHYNILVEKATLTLEVDSDYKFILKEHKVDTSFSYTLENKRIKHIWRVSDVQKIQEESYGPSYVDLKPWVRIIPQNFNYAIPGNAESWQAYGDWIYELGSDCDDLNDASIEHLKSIVGIETDKREIIKKLYNHLQDEMRYINVEIDVGGMKPYPASYVATNNYGDCKALTYYMKASLAQFDIESFAVDNLWGTRNQIYSDLPSQQFNHVFLAIPLDGDTIWLENTSKSQPLDYVDTGKAGTLALWIDKGKSQLITLPSFQLQDVLCSSNATYELKGDKFLINFQSVLRGEMFEEYKRASKNWSQADLNNFFQTHYGWSNDSKNNWKIITNDRNDKHLVYQATYEIKGLVKNYGSNKVLFVKPSDLPKIEKPTVSKYELRIKIPENRIDTIEFMVDKNQFSTIKIPMDTLIENQCGSYQLTFAQTETGATCIRHLQIFKGTYAPKEEYSAFYGFIESIKSIEKNAYISLKR